MNPDYSSLLVINHGPSNPFISEFSLCRLLKSDDDALLLGGIHSHAKAWFNRCYFEMEPWSSP